METSAHAPSDSNEHDVSRFDELEPSEEDLVAQNRRSSNEETRNLPTDEQEKNDNSKDRQHVNPLAPTYSRSSGFWRIAQDFLLDSWYWEVAGICISISAAVAICTILWTFDGKPVPQFSGGVTLNALISFLATVSKGCLMLPLASCMGQAKWLWVSKGARYRRLVDMRCFDDASRGPSGSLMLLTSIRSYLGIIGSSIIILALAFETFVQLIVTYPLNSTIRDGAAILYPVANYDIEADILNDNQRSRTLRAINQGIYTSEVLGKTPPFCNGQNCSWPIHSTLSICSSCRDLTVGMQQKLDCAYGPIQNDGGGLFGYPRGFAEYKCTIALPGTAGTAKIDDPGYLPIVPDDYTVFFNLNINTSTSASALAGPIPGSFGGLQSPLYAVMRVALNITEGVDGRRERRIRAATECGLTPCVQILNARIEGTSYIEDLVDVWYGNESENATNSDETQKWSTLSTNKNWTLPNKYQSQEHKDRNGDKEAQSVASTFALSGRSIYALFYFASQTFAGNSTSNDLLAELATSSSFTNAITDPFALKISNIATALTNAMIQQEASRFPNINLPGTVTTTDTYIRVRWEWTILPTSLILAGAIFLGLVIWETRSRGLPNWKGNALALLYHGLDFEDDQNEKENRLRDNDGGATTTARPPIKTAIFNKDVKPTELLELNSEMEVAASKLGVTLSDPLVSGPTSTSSKWRLPRLPFQAERAGDADVERKSCSRDGDCEGRRRRRKLHSMGMNENHGQNYSAAS